MAGHSQFQNIMHRKGIQDAKRAKIFTKLIRELTTAARQGAVDLSINPRLRAAVTSARIANMPRDTIDQAIKRGAGHEDGTMYDSVRYEGFGPNNAMFIVECLTNNTNRTYTDIRTAFTKCGFKLGVDGSVIHLFNNKAVFSFERFNDEETLEILVEAGCDVDDIEFEDGLTTVYAPISEYAKIRDALTKADEGINFLEDQIIWLPQMYTTFTEEKDWEHLERFKAILDEIDDVQDMYHNVRREDE